MEIASTSTSKHITVYLVQMDDETPQSSPYCTNKEGGGKLGKELEGIRTLAGTVWHHRCVTYQFSQELVCRAEQLKHDYVLNTVASSELASDWLPLPLHPAAEFILRRISQWLGSRRLAQRCPYSGGTHAVPNGSRQRRVPYSRPDRIGTGLPPPTPIS